MRKHETNKRNSKESNNNNEDYTTGILPRPKLAKSNLFSKIITFFLPRYVLKLKKFKSCITDYGKTRWAFENTSRISPVFSNVRSVLSHWITRLYMLLHLLYVIDFTRVKQNTRILCFMLYYMITKTMRAL